MNKVTKRTTSRETKAKNFRKAMESAKKKNQHTSPSSECQCNKAHDHREVIANIWANPHKSILPKTIINKTELHIKEEKKSAFSLKNFFLTYWWTVVGLDWSSTVVAHDYRVEENPWVRSVWQSHGDLGFTAYTLLFALIMTGLIIFMDKHSFKRITYPALFLMISFKFLIALTNLALVPYAWTAWFTF